MQQAPMQQAPMQQAPMQQAPMQQAPMQQAPEEPAPRKPAPAPMSPMEQDDLPPTGNDQILGMLSAIEQQLRHLGDTQRQHEDQLASLIDHSRSSAESKPGPAAADPQNKQPSFVVEMDESEQAPQDPAQREGLETMASELETSREQTDQMKRQLEEAQAHIKELGDQPDDARAELEEKAQELEEALQKIDTLQSRVIELEAVAAVDGDDDDSEEREQQIAELEAQVEQLQQELRQRDEAEAKPAPAPADGPGAEMIERQRKQIERLTAQLAAVNAGAESPEIEERDARIAELEEELEDLRGGGGGKQAVSKLVAGFGGALRQVRGEKGAADEEQVAELEERVAELEIERDKLKAEADKARDIYQQAAAGDGSGDDAEEVVALRARVAELESRPGGGPGNHAELRSKIEAELRQKWNEVQRRQDSLSATEEKMRKQWARPRAVVVLGYLAGLAVVVAIVSWLLAGRMFPPTIVASVNVEAKSRSGVPVSDENKAAWQMAHTDMLADDLFHKAVAKRLANQRLDDYKDPDVLGERLQNDLIVDSPKPGAITLTLAGKDQDETRLVLDTVATSMATQSSQQAGKRSDDAIAVVRGERREKGQVRFASINSTPIKDRRFLGAVVIFVIGFVIRYGLIISLGQSLVKAKSAMEDDDLGMSADLF
jgi:hypothetical protein